MNNVSVRTSSRLRNCFWIQEMGLLGKQQGVPEALLCD